MKLKKTIKDGVCAIMRCTAPSVSSNQLTAGEQLCDAHYAAYQRGVSIEPTDKPVKPSSDLVPAKEEIVALVSPIAEDAAEVIEAFANFEITTAEALSTAGELLVDLQTQKKKLDAARKSVTKPLRDVTNRVNAWFKPALDALDKGVNAVKSAITKYEAEQNAIRAQALAEKNTEALAAAPVVDMPSGVYRRGVWRWKLLDITKVPARFLQLNETEVRNYIKEAEGQASIPGLELYYDETIVARARTAD